uniref:Schlafen like 1 n=1 Tax=Latimeria chalumnae TaxID=7897 RepID=H3B3F8_LATCH|nr:PREDICTED: schlafen-like protein 1 [Latimeria chalumnae]XP_014342233.1 PREDICTED: schlafen-like protein 1 [Latimeria chalumnae]|eukprot:XP_014342232.1 PREDICTED: schlafen-like protein 1 [Latimeria chalumnae]
MEEPAIEEPGSKLSTFSVYVGNLNPECTKEDLCCMLKDLISGLNISLMRHDVEVVKKHRRAHAFVRLKTEGDFRQVLKQLQDPTTLDQSILGQLVMVRKKLLVCEDKRCFSHYQEEHPQNGGSHDVPKSLPSVQKRESSKGPIVPSNTNKDHRFAPIGGMADRPVAPLIVTRSEGAIVHRGITGQERFFYGAQIGSETRNVEFKRGGGEYLSAALKHHVRKYACAFLNGEGGSLFVGVDDDGIVRGIECSHKDEDRTRLLVDSILKGYKPPVFPEAYSLSFVPVVKAGDTGLFLKVLRITIHPPKQQGELLLYETDQGEVFLRRDGSIQGPLPGSAIQEWCRQKWMAELKLWQDKVNNLENKNWNLQQQLHQHLQTVNELQQQLMEPQTEQEPPANKRSKICCLM